VQRSVFSSTPRRPKLCGLAQQQISANFHQLTNTSKSPDNVSPSTVVRDLGVFFDSEQLLTMHSPSTSSCFYQLQRLCAVRDKHGQEFTGRLVSAFILSRLDYCNAVLAGLPALTLAPLHQVMHARCCPSRSLYVF